MLTCFEKPVDEHSHGATTEGKHCISGWGSRWLKKLHIFRDNVECTIACMMSVCDPKHFVIQFTGNQMYQMFIQLVTCMFKL